jgi:protein-disulfide isomerase
VLSVGKVDRGAVKVVGTDTIQQLYGGIEQQGASLGPAGAAVSISVFDDLQCRPCAAWYLRTVPPLVEELARTGRAKLVYHHFAMGEHDRQVAFYAAAAAGLQGRQWQYIQIFFTNQALALSGGVTEKLMTRFAEQVPELDVEQWRRDRKDPQIEQVLAGDDKLTIDERLPAKPAVIVDGPGGRRKLVDAPSLTTIRRAIAEVRTAPKT